MGLMRNNMNFIFLVFYILMSTIAFGQEKKLLDNPMRPKLVEVLESHPSSEVISGIPYVGGRLAYQHFKNAIALGAPQLIVKLENTFPGATFAFLGRDTQVIADVVDGFYQSIGQRNRVVQVGISKPTLVGLKDKDIELYLKYYGLDLDKIKNSKGFIFVDTVSSGEVIDGERVSGRQGRQLLQVLYNAWIKRGNDPSELISKLNMVALRVSTFKSDDPGNTKRYRDISQFNEINKLNSQFFKIDGHDTNKIGMDFILPLIKDTPELFNESGYDHFTGAWHEKYLPPLKTKMGYLPQPGSLTHIVYRQSILWLQHQVIDIVSSLEFRQKIKNEADKIGLRFYNLKLDQPLVSCRKVYK